jgi:hypothetical protein
MVSPLSVTVFRGLGGDHILIEHVESVRALLEGEERTDWMWGVGSAYDLLEMDQCRKLRWDHVFNRNF